MGNERLLVYTMSLAVVAATAMFRPGGVRGATYDQWQFETVDTQGYGGEFNSLAVLPNGMPVLSFRGGPSNSDGDMMVAFAVPEPATLILLGLVGIGAAVRRRKS